MRPQRKKSLADDQLERAILAWLKAQMPLGRMSQAAQSRDLGLYFALATMLKAECLKQPDKLPWPHGLVIEKVLAEMRLKGGQRNEVLERMVVDLGRFLSGSTIPAATCVDFLKIVALRALMPIIRTRAEGYACNRNVAADDISDLGEEVVSRISRQLNTGKAPDDNAGAYCARTVYTTWVDYGRKMDRKRVFLGDETDAGGLAQSNDRPAERSIDNLAIMELNPVSRAIVVAARWGYSVKQIMEALGVSKQQIGEVLANYLEGP